MDNKKKKNHFKLFIHFGNYNIGYNGIYKGIFGA